MERLRRWWIDAAPGQRALAALGALLVVGAPLALLVVAPLQRDLACHGGGTARRPRRPWSRRAGKPRRSRRRAPAAPARRGRRACGGRAHRSRSAACAACVTALQGKDGRVEVTFEAIDFAALTALVEALAREARVFPVEALVAARTTPGSVRAEIAFARAAP